MYIKMALKIKPEKAGDTL